jgi:F420-dependent oxidoreductase-like protein
VSRSTGRYNALAKSWKSYGPRYSRTASCTTGIYALPLPEDIGTGLGKPLKLMVRPVRSRIPIYVAALGPSNVRLTAEIADGWLPLFYSPEKADQVWEDALIDGRGSRDPALGPLEVVAGGLLAIGEQAERHLDAARPATALYLGGMGAPERNFYFNLACRYGFTDAANRVQQLFMAGDRVGEASAVPVEFLRATNLCGTEFEVRARVEAHQTSGVTVLNVQPIGSDSPERLLERVRGWLT